MSNKAFNLQAQNSDDQALMDCLCPDEKCRFVEWFGELNERHAAGYAAGDCANGLEHSTGIKHWFDDFVAALTPAEALYKAYGDAII